MFLKRQRALLINISVSVSMRLHQTVQTSFLHLLLALPSFAFSIVNETKIKQREIRRIRRISGAFKNLPLPQHTSNNGDK